MDYWADLHDSYWDTKTESWHKALFTLGVAVLILAFVLFIWRLAQPLVSPDVAVLRQERSRLQQKIETGSRPDVLDTARLSLNDLGLYHAMNLKQGRRSFTIGVIAFFAGLGVIVAGIVIYYIRPTGGVQVAAVSAVGGAIGSFISASCLSLYRGAMSQANYFYQNITQAQDTMIAVRLCDEINDERARIDAIRGLIDSLSRNRNCGAWIV
jgi:predicted small integral membrane protein